VADLTGVATKLQALAVGAVSGLKGVQAHGDITDPEFPGAHFHRGLSVGMPATDYRTGETGTNRAMSPRYKLCRLAVRIGYLFGRDEMAVGATVRSLLPATGKDWNDVLREHRGGEGEVAA